MLHCTGCGVYTGEHVRADFVECPHGDATCEPHASCQPCVEMAG